MSRELKLKKHMSTRDWGAFLLLPLFWSFLLLVLLKFLYPLLSGTIGIGPFYSIIGLMFLFSLIAPLVHHLFYQVDYFKMTCLWLLFTFIGFYTAKQPRHFHELWPVLMHFISWQMPAVVASLIYTLLYHRNKLIKLDMSSSTSSAS